MHLIEPKITPPLDNTFRPAVLANQHYQAFIDSNSDPLAIGLERADENFSRFDTRVLNQNHPYMEANLQYAERLVKFLLWARGGFRVYVGGPHYIGDYIKDCYAPGGSRGFEFHFLGDKVYEQPFEVIPCSYDEVPEVNETGRALGRHLDGYRIGFDLGASDRKVSAVVDGKVIYSEEVVWEPRKHDDPDYHYREVLEAIHTAAEKLPRVDAIGGSSAGIYIHNRPMVASLFRKIPPDRYGEVKTIFSRIREEMEVPLEIINDGDVTALAGSMSLGDNGILGIAMGSSEAAGYVDTNGHILGWLNELAFAPIDYSPQAPTDEWSGDRGCGASYFSQQSVFRLAPLTGITIPQDLTDADRLKYVQEKLEANHDGAIKIWQTMGVYLGYGVAHYADFYDIKHVLILGRCTSGIGGDLILEGAKKVLETEFPDLDQKIHIRLPDEKSRRVGQSIAAASLPALDRHKS
jgi:predicted NBD/HSP70 family sugar kinase